MLREDRVLGEDREGAIANGHALGATRRLIPPLRLLRKMPVRSMLRSWGRICP
jgi:hypothetical protein